MEVTIKINSARDLNRIKKIFERRDINVIYEKSKGRQRKKPSKANKITQEVFRKTDKGEELVKCKDVNDFFKKLGV